MKTQAEVFIPLTQGKVAVIDFDDFERVRPHKWYASRERQRCYAKGHIECRKIYLHRFLLLPPYGKQIDHINGDGLDNRRDNLRVVSHAENNRAFKQKKPGASSKFRGVSWNKLNKNWNAHISVNGVKIHLGCYQSEASAARAFNTAATKRGFAKEALNLIIEGGDRRSETIGGYELCPSA